MIIDIKCFLEVDILWSIYFMYFKNNKNNKMCDIAGLEWSLGGKLKTDQTQ